MSTPRDPLVTHSITTTDDTPKNITSLTDLFKALKAADLMVMNDSREDIQAAVEIYTQAIEFPKGSIVCYKSRAVAYHRLGKFTEAVQDFTTYLDKHPEDGEIQVQKAWSLFYLKQYPEALELLTQALQLNPTLIKAQNTLINFARIFLREHLSTNAIACLQLVLRHNPQHPEPYPLLASAYAQQRNLDQTIASYEQGLRQATLSAKAFNNIHQSLAEAYTLRANALLDAKQIPQAMDAYLTAMEHNPEYAGLYCGMGNFYLETKNYKLALNHFKKALELKNDYADAYIGIGNVHAEQKAYGLAEQDYKEALKHFPQHPDVHNNLGIIYHAQERYSAAFEAFQTGLNINPPQSDGAARIHSNRARVYQTIHKLPEAIEAQKLALAIEPDSTTEKEYLATLLYLHADQEFKVENFQNCIKILNEALAYASDTTSIKQGLAFSHYRLGTQLADSDLDAAIQHMDLSLKYEPLNANNLSNRGVLWLRKGEFDKALQDFAKTLELDPNHFPCLFNRGLHYFHQGAYDESINDLNKICNESFKAKETLIHAYIKRAQKNSAADKVDEAISDLTQVITLAPSLSAYKIALAQHHHARAMQRLARGQNSEALEDLKQALQLDPAAPPALRDELSKLYFQEGKRCFHASQYEEAIEFFKALIKLEPEHLQASYFYARALIGKNELNEALTHFRNCIRLDPNFSDAYNDLAVTLRALKYRPEEVLPYYQDALLHNPDSTVAHFNLGNYYSDLNDLTAAYTHYQQVLQLDPNDQEAELLITELYQLLFNRGAAYIADGKNLEAAKDFACLAQRETQNVDVLYNCGLAFCLAGDFSKALPYLKQAEKGDKNDHKIHYYLGLAYQQTKDFKAAMNKFSLVKQLAPKFAQERNLNQELAFCSRNLRAETTAFNTKKPLLPQGGNFSWRQFKPKSTSHAHTHNEPKQELKGGAQTRTRLRQP